MKRIDNLLNIAEKINYSKRKYSDFDYINQQLICDLNFDNISLVNWCLRITTCFSLKEKKWIREELQHADFQEQNKGRYILSYHYHFTWLFSYFVSWRLVYGEIGAWITFYFSFSLSLLSNSKCVFSSLKASFSGSKGTRNWPLKYLLMVI